MGKFHRKLDRKRWARVRRSVLERDGYACKKCGRRGRLEVDHIQPLQRGGAEFDPANLQALCRPCHFAKTRREHAERFPAASAWTKAVSDLM